MKRPKVARSAYLNYVEDTKSEASDVSRDSLEQFCQKHGQFSPGLLICLAQVNDVVLDSQVPSSVSVLANSINQTLETTFSDACVSQGIHGIPNAVFYKDLDDLVMKFLRRQTFDIALRKRMIARSLESELSKAFFSSWEMKA